MQKVSKKKYVEVIEELLLPTSTLVSVGKNWGITRERVRQIFNLKTGLSWRPTRKKLLCESEKFCCPVCGKSVDPRTHTVYCSAKCRHLLDRFDVRDIRKCKYCKKLFFPFHNWRALSQTVKASIAQYCCMSHYMLDGGPNRKRFSKNSTSFKNLTRSPKIQ